ncbi:hypothetical protein DRW07_12795 [Alteromonas sediminis]|uniref:DUF6471 domain-containing protein n=1 Tax=Alteromonas sediminis TaxID=2259342 RepID=A0A3N5YKZ0_9ALTE|nr:DUF6471 domain-containing protein [Alteromonas sediminis]RPJ65691.1 hypothetical protein DRW07_12795 [Alteromonas sediminis]
MWRETVSRIIKSEMSARGVKYQDLSDRLKTLGIQQSADNLRNKINKGILGADLFVQILLCLESQALDMVRVKGITEDVKKNAPNK